MSDNISEKAANINASFTEAAGYSYLSLQTLIVGLILVSICVWVVITVANTVRADVEPIQKIHRFLLITLFAGIVVIITLAI